MEGFWLYEAFTAALAASPTRLKERVERLRGGGDYSTAILPVVVGEQQYAQLSFCRVTGSRLGAER